MTWTYAMGHAYTHGIRDGQDGKEPAPARGDGFDACYMQGYEHGLKLRELHQELVTTTRRDDDRPSR